MSFHFVYIVCVSVFVCMLSMSANTYKYNFLPVSMFAVRNKLPFMHIWISNTFSIRTHIAMCAVHYICIYYIYITKPDTDTRIITYRNMNARLQSKDRLEMKILKFCSNLSIQTWWNADLMHFYSRYFIYPIRLHVIFTIQLTIFWLISYIQIKTYLFSRASVFVHKVALLKPHGIIIIIGFRDIKKRATTPNQYQKQNEKPNGNPQCI